jgi:hypothetical protein
VRVPTTIVCEPQCWGYEHAAVNAAILHTVALAFPERGLIFLAEPSHLQWVQEVLRREAPASAARITWQEVAVPERQASPWRRVRQEQEWCRLILEMAARPEVGGVLLTSITSPGLLALKLRLYRRGSPVPIVAVPHALLGTLLEPPPLRPSYWLLALRQVLSLPHPGNLSYVALGEPIAATLRSTYPRLGRHFTTLELPVLWATRAAPAPPAAMSRIRFGFFGAGAHPAKGYAAFVKLASDVAHRSGAAEFVLVGNAPAQPSLGPSADIISGSSTEALTSAEYYRRAAGIHYAVWTGGPRHYRLRASATFLDALSYVKPGIYLRNSYLEYYFDRLGDIGYLCDSYDEMADVVVRIAADFPAERYEQQCANILQRRGIFEPAALASRMRAILSQSPA